MKIKCYTIKHAYSTPENLLKIIDHFKSICRQKSYLVPYGKEIKLKNKTTYIITYDKNSKYEYLVLLNKFIITKTNKEEKIENILNSFCYDLYKKYNVLSRAIKIDNNEYFLEVFITKQTKESDIKIQDIIIDKIILIENKLDIIINIMTHTKSNTALFYKKTVTRLKKLYKKGVKVYHA